LPLSVKYSTFESNNIFFVCSTYHHTVLSHKAHAASLLWWKQAIISVRKKVCQFQLFCRLVHKPSAWYRGLSLRSTEHGILEPCQFSLKITRKKLHS
jgi:hypothetical protein